MWAILGNMLAALTGTLLARVLTGAGLAIVTYGVLKVSVATFLATVAGLSSGLPAGLVAIIQISGVGDGLSMVGSAMLVKAALASASVGIKKAAA